MNKEEIIQALRELAQYLELDGENPFKIRSYLRSAEILEHTPESIDTLIETGKLRSLEGIGEAIEKKIIAWYHNEPVPALEKVKKKYPPTLLELFSVQSLGAKRIRSLYDNLHITNMDELYKACLEGKVSTLPGFNKKIENKIIESIQLLYQWKGQFLLSQGWNTVKKLFEELSSIIERENIYIVGSLRRYEETVRNINLLFLYENKEHILDKLVSHFPEIQKQKQNNEILLHYSDFPVLINFAEKTDLGAKLVYYTGSRDYINQLIHLCHQKNFSFSEEGFKDSKGQKIITETERMFYEKINTPYIPPELRNLYDDIELVYPYVEKIVKPEDIKGIVHCHTQYSDGYNSISELADYCISKGWSYIVICDHSQSAGYANGLSPEDIIKQHEEIDNLNRYYKRFKILKGIECDIKSDGTLDYPDEILSTFDIVIGSIHTKLDMDKATATQRLLKAIENPYLDVLGHLSGRLLLSRKGYPLDMDEIFQACKDNHVAIEINANPQRLDIDWRNIYKAKKYNLKFVISVDAHSIEGIDDITYGVYVARKGLLTPDEVLNCQDAEEFKNCLRRKR